MGHVILFGGGDGGGFIITANGIKPIPPWTPKLAQQLRAVSALARVSKDRPAGVVAGREFTPLLEKLSVDAIGQVATQAGAGEHSFVYVDDDGGGFRCGSTGKPPIPFPPKGLGSAVEALR